MTGFPTYRFPTLPILTPWSLESRNVSGATFFPAGSATSTAWPTANSANFYPFTLTDFQMVYQLLLWIGSTASGNVDIGIYDGQWNLLVSSGSTGMGTIDVVQEFNVTDTPLSPGRYFLAVGCDNTTGTTFTANILDDFSPAMYPIYLQTGLTGPTLPAVAAPALSNAAAPRLAVCGIQFRSTPF